MILNILTAGLGLFLVLSLIYLFAAAAATFLLVHPFRFRSGCSPKAYNLPFKRVQFYSSEGQIKLTGWVIRHEQVAENLVIICHGLHSSKSEDLPLAAFLFRNGFDCFLFDFRAHGESSGFFSNLGYREKEDLLGAIRFVETEHLTLDGKVIVIGISMGAAVSLLTAAETDRIQLLVSDSSYADGMSLLKKNFPLFFHGLPRKYFWSICWGMLKKVGKYPENPDSPLDAVKKLKHSPVFFIHGEQDKTIPVSHTKALFKKFSSQKKFLWIVPETDHAEAYEKQPVLYQEKLLAFLGKEAEKRSREGQLQDGAVDVAAGAVVSDGKVIVARRIKGKHLEGMWEFPGGKLETNESPQMAVIREMREEVNLEVIVEHLIDTIEYQYPDRKVRIYFFKCRVLQGELKPIRWGEVRWVNHQELEQLEFPSANQRVLPMIKEYLKP